MRFLRDAGSPLLVCLWLASVGWALPAEVTVQAGAKFEILRGEKVAGSLSLNAGEKLELVDIAGEYALVRYRNLNGRVALAKTDLPQNETVTAAPAPRPALDNKPASAAPVAAPAPQASAPAKTVAAPTAPYSPTTPIEQVLHGKLVRLDGGALRPFDPARLARVKFYGIYFSASWCGPCREFTPGLVDAYTKIREIYPEFEIVLVNRDRSAAEMQAYMRDDHMPWPALRYESIKDTGKITRYAGSGIPCLVLVDENGKVLSDTYRWGRYVGPTAVLDDTWKILRDYRRKNPRTKT